MTGISGAAREHARLAVSLFLAFFQLYIGLIHLSPGLVARAFPINPTWGIVRAIQSLGPVIPAAFALTGVLLAMLLIFVRRWVYMAHVLCFAVLLGYATALLIGSFSEVPRGPILIPSLCLVPMLMHALLALAYGGEQR